MYFQYELGLIKIKLINKNKINLQSHILYCCYPDQHKLHALGSFDQPPCAKNQVWGTHTVIGLIFKEALRLLINSNSFISCCSRFNAFNKQAYNFKLIFRFIRKSFHSLVSCRYWSKLLMHLSIWLTFLCFVGKLYRNRSYQKQFLRGVAHE